MHRDPQAYCRNWIEPAATAKLLEWLVVDPPLSPATNAFWVETLTTSRAFPIRLPTPCS